MWQNRRSLHSDSAIHEAIPLYRRKRPNGCTSANDGVCPDIGWTNDPCRTCKFHAFANPNLLANFLPKGTHGAGAGQCISHPFLPFARCQNALGVPAKLVRLSLTILRG